MGKFLRDGLFLRGKIWWMSFTALGQHYRKSTKTTNKKVADSILAKKRVAIAEGRFLEVRRESNLRFKDFSAEYIKNYAMPNKRSWKSSDSNSINHLNRFFGNYALSNITSEMVEEYVRLRRAAVIGRLADGADKFLKPASVNRELSCLNAMYNKAIEWGRVSLNPCSKVKKFKESNRTRFLSEDEMVCLISNASLKLREALVILIHTGMRKGELQNLKWSDVDFDHNLITLAKTKNGKLRHIPMNDAVKQVLLRCRIKKGESTLVFSGKKPGKSWDFRKPFEIARKRAGLTDICVHTLRHTFASHLCMGGTDLMTVKELLGHSSLSMTERYSHIGDQHKAEAVRKLQRLPVKDDTFIAQSSEGSEEKEFEKIVSDLKTKS